jgi:hypothetical protein
MGKNDVPASFADLIESAQKEPPVRQVMRGTELSSPFGMSVPPEHRVVEDDPRQIAGVPEFDYQAHVAHLVMPNDAAKYEAILNDTLAGKCILRKEDANFTKEGDYIVVVIYLTKLDRPRRPNLRREENDYRR